MSWEEGQQLEDGATKPFAEEKMREEH